MRRSGGGCGLHRCVVVHGRFPRGEGRQNRRAHPYRVTADLLEAAAPGAIFLHCLPAHRGEEVAGDVIDGLTSQAFPQAANRLPTAQAVLEALLGRIVADAP
ncbi:hypothetical protein [Nonomuraea solani]|uniref:hypothetical protein n=1 Tax=Nonomuraea solani TaxID=1144553 RepID=UPI001F3066A2|nr:hypothetical protein [Nonomuraea solani]